MTTLAIDIPESRIQADRASSNTRDISGYEIFDQGASGAAHALAHRLLDSGQFESGRHALGDWLKGRSGSGSDWVHLQFHMAIFELALGEWEQAHARFHAQVLPTAATTAQALTDAPALLWRLTVASPNTVTLPWQPLRRVALAKLFDSDKPFIQVHNLLALAGAGDSRGIEHWLHSENARQSTQPERLVVQIAQALRSLADGFYRQAGQMLQSILPQVSLLDGSHAQLGLFAQLAAWCAQQAYDSTRAGGYLNAA